MNRPRLKLNTQETNQENKTQLEKGQDHKTGETAGLAELTTRTGNPGAGLTSLTQQLWREASWEYRQKQHWAGEYDRKHKKSINQSTQESMNSNKSLKISTQKVHNYTKYYVNTVGRGTE